MSFHGQRPGSFIIGESDETIASASSTCVNRDLGDLMATAWNLKAGGEESAMRQNKNWW